VVVDGNCIAAEMHDTRSAVAVVSDGILAGDAAAGDDNITAAPLVTGRTAASASAAGNGDSSPNAAAPSVVAAVAKGGCRKRTLD